MTKFRKSDRGFRLGTDHSCSDWPRVASGRAALRQRLRAEATSQAVESAAAFSPEELRGLSGTGRDTSAAAYRAAKERLFRLQAFTPRARLLFLLRVDPRHRQGGSSWPTRNRRGPASDFSPARTFRSVFRSAGAGSR